MPHAHQLGRYLLLDRIAFGGMAEIFRAKTFDAEGRVHLVAIKRVLAHLVEDEDFLQMIIDEARISATLQHENIARLYEFAHADGEYFLAMEFVDGKDLRAVIERVRPDGRGLPAEHAAWVAMEAARALHAAHSQRDARGNFLRIVHRDVSPSNLLCGYRGEVKLCDFGIAKATLTRIQTKTGVIKGKVKYMSPEQAMGRKLDHRSDLFSLGTVMYEALTLTPPFAAATEVELIFAVRDGRRPPLTELRPDLPDDLVAIVDKAMSKSRTNRYQSGEDMAADLQLFLDHYAPGYRRSHFAAFMRARFAEAIEDELRQLEAFVLAEADATRIGDNLIADTLAPDAPFTTFTPFAPDGSQGTDTSGYYRLDPDDGEERAELSAEPTQMKTRAELGLDDPGTRRSSLHEERTRITPGPSRHEQATRVTAGAAALHAEPTRIFTAPVRGGTLHEESTRLHAAPPALHEEPTGERTRPDNLHEEETGERLLPEARLHDEDTGEKHLPATGLHDEDTGKKNLRRGGLHDEDTGKKNLRGGGLHDEDTGEKRLPAGGLHDEDTGEKRLPTTRPGEGSGARSPLAAEPTRIVGFEALREALSVAAEPTRILDLPRQSLAERARARPALAGETGEDEDTSVPLSDEDLEDVE